MCSSVAKFNYDALADGWSHEFFERIGLGDLAEDDFAKIGGEEIVAPGTPIGRGLTAKAAQELGLLPGLAVGASLDDAYAGGLSLFGCAAPAGANIGGDGWRTRMGEHIA